jgi:predicted PurR-regulated permease PerM
VLRLVGLYILHVPLAPLWAAIAAVLQIAPHLGPILGRLGPVLAATIMWRDWEHPLGVPDFSMPSSWSSMGCCSSLTS